MLPALSWGTLSGYAMGQTNRVTMLCYAVNL